MKIHFTASLTGKKLYKQNYEEIVVKMRELGYKVMDVTFNKEKNDIENLTRTQLDENFQKILKSIKNSDIVVAEVSYSSVSVGFEVTTALRLSKQVLLLHVPTNHVSLLEATKDRNLTVCEYTLGNLEAKLPEVLRRIENDINVRFNFFIPKSLLAHLDLVTLNQRMNKSEYVRQLIERDMKRNKRRYQEKLK